jgi:hypothetical protein
LSSKIVVWRFRLGLWCHLCSSLMFFRWPVKAPRGAPVRVLQSWQVLWIWYSLTS